MNVKELENAEEWAVETDRERQTWETHDEQIGW
jgi:hypothetical protein